MLNRLAKLAVPMRAFSLQVNHTPSPHNTTSHVFNFTAENEKEIQDILSRYPINYKKSAVIPILFIAQTQNDNFLTLSAMQKVAEILEIPYMDVYEVATFYTMFNRTRIGKFHLQVCRTTPCMVRGSDEVIHAIEKHLNIKSGETTKDGLFTLVEVECLGACVNAPMMQVNNEWVYEDLNEENVVKLLDNFRDGKEVKKGPQNHRINSEGPQGRNCLTDKEKIQSCGGTTRDFKKAKEDWLKAKEEAANQQK